MEKTAAFEPPLSVRANSTVVQQEADDSEQKTAQTLAEMRDYLDRHFVRPNHGQLSVPALFEAIKEKFGIHGLSRAGGIERVKQMIEKLKAASESINPASSLPTYDGQPLQMSRDQGQDQDRSDFLTQDTSAKM